MPDDKALPPPPPLPAAGPPKKSRGKSPPGAAPAKLSVSELAQVRLQQALYAGFVIYLQNPGMSIAAVWESGTISTEENAPLIRECIAQNTFYASAADNQWSRRRDAHWSEVRARVEAKLMDQHVERTLDDIRGIASLRVVALQHIKGDANANIKAVQPKSLEGVMKAYVELTKLEGELRGTVIEQAADAAKAKTDVRNDPQVPGAAAALILEDDGFSDDDIQAMARAAALNASLGGKQVIEGQAAIVASPATSRSDNETLQRPVMEPL